MCFWFNKCSHNKISKLKVKLEIYTIANNTIALCKLNDKEVLDDDGIKTYPLESNIPFIKNFSDKIKPNYIE